MKTILISILVLVFSHNVLAGEQKGQVTTYSADKIKALKIGSVGLLIENYENSKGLEIHATDSTLYLVNGKRVEMTSQEKNSKILAATSIEILGDGRALVINVIL